MLTPRAADDFAIIRGRLEELRRERARASPEMADRAAPATAPGSGAESREPKGEAHRLSHAAHQRLFG